jgi:hypothetical protein
MTGATVAAPDKFCVNFIGVAVTGLDFERAVHRP